MATDTNKTGLVWKLTYCAETTVSPQWAEVYYATEDEAKKAMQKLNRRETSGAYVCHAPE